MKKSPRSVRGIALLAMMAVGAGIMLSADDITGTLHLDPSVVAVNKLPARADFEPYRVREGKRSKQVVNLGGVWDFHYYESCKDLPKTIADVENDAAGRKDIKVPGNWEVQGFGTPIYVNQPYEFQPRNPKPPTLPADIPVGVYTKRFSLPTEWQADDVYLRVGAAKSGMYVYVNGRFVGYSEDSKNPADFLINPYLRKGENVVSLLIYRWSTGSYLECQDFWRISGIERDVELIARPAVNIADLGVRSTLDDAYRTGDFKLWVDVANKLPRKQNIKVAYRLIAPNGSVAAEETAAAEVAPGDTATVEFASAIRDVVKWSAEHPDLYKLEVGLSAGRQDMEAVVERVGFRRIEIADAELKDPSGAPYKQLLVNGKPVKIRGVNIHEHNPATGHFVTDSLIRKDFELMKAHNINAVRLCHYPQSRRFYELADEYGLYVYDEANIESHGMGYKLDKGRTLANAPEWLDAHMDRTVNMMKRNKNHASVCFWSLGNEAGNGYNFYQTYLWAKDAEKPYGGRPVNYERAQWEWNTDMYVPQYPSAIWLEKKGEGGSDRPIVMSEYSHAMGNSNGGLNSQWEAIRKYPNLGGGFIWDWVDQGLDSIDANGRKIWTYGGDYGKDAPSDGNFLCNGLVNPDRNPHPALSEVKYAYRYVSFRRSADDPEALTVTNEFGFTDLGDYDIEWSLIVDGVKTEKGTLHLDLAPQTTGTLKLPAVALKNDGAGERFLNLQVVSKKASPGLKVGSVIATEQIALGGSPRNKEVESAGATLAAVNSAAVASAKSPNVEFVFDKAKGEVTSYKVDGHEFLYEGSGIRPNFWRGPTDNDYGNEMPSKSQQWKEAGLDLKPEKAEARKAGNNVVISVVYNLPTSNKLSLDYTVFPSGAVKMDYRYAAADSIVKVGDIPRHGLRFRVAADMDKVTYYGNGPDENYDDRKAGSHVGRYNTYASAMAYPYVRPQETGHRSGVRDLTLISSYGPQLMVKADAPIGFNALRYALEDLDSEEASDRPYQWRNFSAQEIASRDDKKAKNVRMRQTHFGELQQRPFIEVCLDGRHRGLGGFDSWGALPEADYLISPYEDFVWSVTFIPAVPR